MYIGADFLIDPDGSLHLSEVNTGVPAGATEYDLVFRSRHGRPSGIFDRIESLARELYGRTFTAHIHSLPWLDQLAALKIWMDGRGPRPEGAHPALRLEDKWIQYSLLSGRFGMIPTRLWNRRVQGEAARKGAGPGRWVLKRRMARGGRGLRVITDLRCAETRRLPENLYLLQPYIESRVAGHSLSIRAAAFSGHFLCMFASLAARDTSNHGIRFMVRPGETLSLPSRPFETRTVVQRAWEAEIFYRGKIPGYLYHDVHVEEISGAALTVPQELYREIRRIASDISRIYAALDFQTLPPACFEEPGGFDGPSL